jgi:DNA-binding winged helix-turn-helix (wHTH) protein/Tol biopolymer transport system component
MRKQENELYEFGPFRINSRERLLSRDGEPLQLTPKAFETLLVLIKNSGHLMLKEELMKAVWPDSFVEEVNLSQNISTLRKALGDAAQGSRYIVTVPGQGYRFVGEVRECASATQPFFSRGDVAEEVVIASRTRSRVLIEETEEDESGRAVEPPFLPQHQIKALPLPVAGKSHLARMLSILLGVAIGAVATWALFRPVPVPKVLRSVQLTHVGRVEPYGRVLSDGSRLYFTERIGGTWGLAEIGEQGGEPALISTSVANPALYDLDLSASRLLVADQGPVDDRGDPLWIVSTLGGSAQRLGNIVAEDAAWSPDGRNIAYCLQGALFVVGDDGLRPRKLLSIPGKIMLPRWSPDGRHISFTVRELSAGVLSLWEVDASGQNAHAISFGWKNPREQWNEGESCGSWSPDGRFFIFRSIRGGVNSFWIARDADHNVRFKAPPSQLYSSPDWLAEPRFNAKGNKIVFVDYQERRELVRYDSERGIFVPFLGGIPARHLSFSPDGQWVAYKNETDGSLWRSRSDGTQALQLSFPPLEALHSSWSPDERAIAFQASGKLYRIPFEGGSPELLIEGSQPSWSPDGKSILFTRWQVQDIGGWRPSIHVLNLSTGREIMIPGSENFEAPQYSPDGRYAAASDKKDEKLMLYEFAAQRWSELADGLPYGWGIRWSKDSQYVYYQHIHDGEEQPIFRVRVGDRRVEQITSSRQILRADVLSYSMTGLTPDNSPVASLVHRNSDIYALELERP